MPNPKSRRIRSGELLNGLCIAVLASMLLSRGAFSIRLQDQLPYLYFFSAISLLLFYRARIYK